MKNTLKVLNCFQRLNESVRMQLALWIHKTAWQSKSWATHCLVHICCECDPLTLKNHLITLGREFTGYLHGWNSLSAQKAWRTKSRDPRAFNLKSEPKWLQYFYYSWPHLQAGSRAGCPSELPRWHWRHEAGSGAKIWRKVEKGWKRLQFVGQVLSCLLVTLITCLKGHKSPRAMVVLFKRV